MASHQVIRTAKESVWNGGAHRHVASLCLAEGGRVSKFDAISRIRRGIDTYHTFVAGERAELSVVDQCTRCSAAYLRTDRDTTTRSNLLELPDC